MPRAPEPPKKKKKNSPFACSGSTLCRKLSKRVDEPSRSVDAVSIIDIFMLDLLASPLNDVDDLSWALNPSTDDALTAMISKSIVFCIVKLAGEKSVTRFEWWLMYWLLALLIISIRGCNWKSPHQLCLQGRARICKDLQGICKINFLKGSGILDCGFRIDLLMEVKFHTHTVTYTHTHTHTHT